MLYDRSSSYDFFSISKDLEPPGVLCESRKYKFKFNAVDKPHETYSGINVRLRYFVRLSVHRNYARYDRRSEGLASLYLRSPGAALSSPVNESDCILGKVLGCGWFFSSIIKEQDFVVQNVSPPPEIKNSIKMEVSR